ncbi:MAG: multi-sensor signal transduction histidine kinase, partial [bacterium]|nr:multi-sensor signal transduction histidine kinase [bacterium]
MGQFSTKPSTLPQILDESAAQLIAGVEETISSTTAAIPLRRTIERLPALMRDLIGRLRTGRVDERDDWAALPIELDTVPLVNALRRINESIYALIDDEHVPVTPLEERIISDWFAAVVQAALAAENRRFADMLDAIPDHLMLHDPEAHLIYVNEATAEVGRWSSGLDPEETLGRRVIDFVRNKKFGQMVYDNVMRVVAGETITEDFVLPHPDGGRWGEHHVLPIHGSQERIEAIATASRDIHDRKKAEGRLQLLSKLDALAATTDAEGIVDALARLSLPELADWCIVHTIESGQVQRATIAHRDPAKAALAAELAHIPPQLHALAVGKLALAGTPSLVDDIAEAIESADPAFIELAQRLGMRSAMIVPFIVMGAPIALAVFLMTPESGRRYVADDLTLAQELAQRAARSIENERLRQQLRQSDARFRVALAHAKISVFETDRELRFRWGYGSLLANPDGRVGETLCEVLGSEVGGD